MTQIDFVEFTGIELLVNSTPFYFGGPIKHDQQQAALLGMVRLHQMNGIQKRIKIPLPELTTLLTEDLSERHEKYYNKELVITVEIRETLEHLIKKGIKLKSNYETLVQELALYKIEFLSEELNLDQFCAFSLNQGVIPPSKRNDMHDPADLLISYPDFSSNLFTAIKNSIKAWPSKIETLLEVS